MAFQQVFYERTPLADSYRGNAESCLFSFKLSPEQLGVNRFFYPQLAERFASQLRDSENAELLETTIWEDISPMFWTEYQVKVVSTASPIAWAIIIPIILGILFLVALTFVILETRKLIWGPGNGGISLVSIVIIAIIAFLAIKLIPVLTKPKKTESVVIREVKA